MTSLQYAASALSASPNTRTSRTVICSVSAGSESQSRVAHDLEE